MNEEKIEYDPNKHISIEWLNKVAHRDICLIYRAVLLFIIEKWREENDTL